MTALDGIFRTSARLRYSGSLGELLPEDMTISLEDNFEVVARSGEKYLFSAVFLAQPDRVPNRDLVAMIDKHLRDALFDWVRRERTCGRPAVMP